VLNYRPFPSVAAVLVRSSICLFSTCLLARPRSIPEVSGNCDN